MVHGRLDPCGVSSSKRSFINGLSSACAERRAFGQMPLVQSWPTWVQATCCQAQKPHHPPHGHSGMASASSSDQSPKPEGRPARSLQSASNRHWPSDAKNVGVSSQGEHGVCRQIASGSPRHVVQHYRMGGYVGHGFVVQLQALLIGLVVGWGRHEKSSDAFITPALNPVTQFRGGISSDTDHNWQFPLSLQGRNPRPCAVPLPSMSASPPSCSKPRGRMCPLNLPSNDILQGREVDLARVEGDQGHAKALQ